jgi:hypothetical protein
MIKRRKANILTENIIFIILNLLFLSILILFVFSKSGGAAVLEEKYSKQIALILDSAKPGMTIRLNMDDALNKKEKDFDSNSIVAIQNNIVTMQLREKGGYSYSFFNDIDVNYYFDSGTSSYIFIINNYNNEIENE